MLFSENVSIHLMLQFIQIVPACHQSLICFNTSHVVVYLDLFLQFLKIIKFQYISCCSLSVFLISNSKILYQFQYISCCSLSFINASTIYFIFVSIHLMLQFIVKIAGAEGQLLGFNTSHVVVYRIIEICGIIFKLVSIHLMLQFIRYTFLQNIQNFWFQYISCCSLSSLFLKSAQVYHCFNTSHVVVYHLTYITANRFYSCFNTSHVVVYH